MKKLFLLAAVAATAFVSCSKNDAPEAKKEGVQMTLKASFAPDTKLEYTPGSSVIKSSWDATETISVITLDNTTKGNVVAIDNFTSTGTAGRTTAEFTGTFTGGSAPTKVIVIYPGLNSSGATPYYVSSSGNFQALTGIETGLNTLHATLMPLIQTKDNDCAHFKNYIIASGVADLTDITTNVLTVNLKNMIPVLKIKATFPDSYKGKTLKIVEILSFDSGDVEKNVFKPYGWDYVDFVSNGAFTFPGATSNNKIDIRSSFAIPSSGEVTLYLPFCFSSAWHPETTDYWKFTAVAEGMPNLVATKTFTKDVTFETNKVYTVNITF